MFIKNVTLDDDSLYGALGSYECHAFAVGDAVERRHGFSVNVITSTTCKLFLLYFLVIYDFLAMRETQPRGKCFFSFLSILIRKYFNYSVNKFIPCMLFLTFIIKTLLVHNG